MDADGLSKRLSHIEADLAADRKHRHDHNSQIASIIDSMRCDQHDDRDRLAKIESDISVMARSVSELVGAFQGSMGFDGIVKMVKDQAVDIAQLKSWKDSMKAYLAGWVCASTLFSSAVMYFINKL